MPMPEMDAAAERAVKELTTVVLAQMTPKERDGAQKFLDWVLRWRGSAGYRRLFRLTKGLKLNGPPQEEAE